MNSSEMKMAHIDNIARISQPCSKSMAGPESSCKFRGGKKLIYPGNESDTELLHEAANAAITDYNKRMNANFKPVRVLKSHVLVTGGLEFDIKFEAQDETRVPAYFMATVWLKVANQGTEVDFCCPYFEQQGSEFITESFDFSQGSEFFTESLDFSQESSRSNLEEVEPLGPQVLCASQESGGSSMEEVELVDHMIDG